MVINPRGAKNNNGVDAFYDIIGEVAVLAGLNPHFRKGGTCGRRNQCGIFKNGIVYCLEENDGIFFFLFFKAFKNLCDVAAGGFDNSVYGSIIV